MNEVAPLIASMLSISTGSRYPALNLPPAHRLVTNDVRSYGVAAHEPGIDSRHEGRRRRPPQRVT